MVLTIISYRENFKLHKIVYTKLSSYSTDLLRCLSKVVNKSNSGCLFDLIIDTMDINIAFIEQVMEDIIGLDCTRSLLSVTKD
jgi:hypothetical protein